MRLKFLLVSRLKYFFSETEESEYAGPLPDEIKIMLRSHQKSDAVEMLIAFLKTEESQNLFVQTGVG
jgi:hypothetical protein